MGKFGPRSYLNDSYCVSASTKQLLMSLYETVCNSSLNVFVVLTQGVILEAISLNDLVECMNTCLARAY